jgi:hypothetical protein
MRNGLSAQLQMIARLLAGGCKTKVFLVRIGGFDTHADQVTSYDPTMGVHAALMYHISSAMEAFQRDLRERSLEDRVLTVTTSEFGRRIYSNGSYGTDHGTGGPAFIFGKGVKPGVVGKVPDLTKDNVEMQYDYRQIYANLLKDWMLVDDTTLQNDVFFGNFVDGTVDGVTYQPLPLANDIILGSEGFVSSRFALESCYPNPAKDSVTFKFKVNNADEVSIDLVDNKGNTLKRLLHGFFEPGTHEQSVSIAGLEAGLYVCKMKSGFFSETKKLIIQ